MSTAIKILPTAEPFFYPGNEIGCLLVHGLTGTPKEMQGLAKYLNKIGYSVIAIRLPGHATSPEDMSRVRWTDWITNLQDGWNFLNSYLETKFKETKIYLTGLSLGGVLSLIFASDKYSDDYPIDGIIAMSTPYAFKQDWRLAAIGLLQYFLPFIPKDSEELFDQDLGPEHIAYPVIPTRGIVELKKLLAELPEVLPTISAPILLLHAAADNNQTNLEPDSMLKIFEKLGSVNKHMHWVESGGHNMLMDIARNEVYDQIASFINNCNVSK